MLVNLSGSEKSAGRDTIGKNVTALLGIQTSFVHTALHADTCTHRMSLTDT